MNGLPLYMTDPDAWQAQLAEGNAKQARKRVCADALIRNDNGRILLVDPNYKPNHDLPGGMAEANERPDACVRRELREELGLDLALGRLLVIDWVPPHGPWDDMLAFVFDGGTLPRSAAIRMLDGELNGFGFYSPELASRMLSARQWRRTEAALAAARTGTAAYLADGYPLGSIAIKIAGNPPVPHGDDGPKE